MASALGSSVAAILLLLCLSTGSSLTSAGRILHENGQDQDSSDVPLATADDVTAAADGAKQQGAVLRKIGRGPLVKKAEEAVPASSASVASERPSQLTVIPGEGLVITSAGEGGSSLSGAQQASLGSEETTAVAEKGEAAASISAVTLSDDGDLGAGGFIAEDDPEAEKHAAEGVAAMMYKGMMLGTSEGAQAFVSQALSSQTRALPSSGSANNEAAGSVKAAEEVPQENNEILISLPGSSEVSHVMETDVVVDSSMTSSSDSVVGSTSDEESGREEGSASDVSVEVKDSELVVATNTEDGAAAAGGAAEVVGAAEAEPESSADAAASASAVDQVLVAGAEGESTGDEMIVEEGDGESLPAKAGIDDEVAPGDSVPVEWAGGETVQQEATRVAAVDAAEVEATASSGGEVVTAEELVEEVTGPHIMLVNDLMPEKVREETEEPEIAKGRGGMGTLHSLVSKLRKAVLAFA